MNRPTTDAGELTEPWAGLYAANGWEPPVLVPVPPDAIPEPQRTLLVHQRDMTRTLESFHGGRIHLRPITRQRLGDVYFRLVVLELDGSGHPIEFGATKAFLHRLPERTQALILEGHRPLGGIFNDEGVRYRSAPTAFFRTAADGLIREAFGLDRDVLLFGRRNTLSNELGEPLAEILEILPPGPVRAQA
jgi:chorismate-pyruvate lyase